MPYPSPRPAPPNGPGTCPRCLEPVIWCLTEANRVPQAVDRSRNEDANQAVRQDHTGRWLVRQLTNERPFAEGSEGLHMPHVSTCRVPAPRTPHRARHAVRPIRSSR